MTRGPQQNPFAGPFADALRGVRATHTRVRSSSPAAIILGILLFAIVGLVVLPVLLIALIGMSAIALVGVALGRVRTMFGSRDAAGAFRDDGRRNVRVMVRDGNP